MTSVSKALLKKQWTQLRSKDGLNSKFKITTNLLGRTFFGWITLHQLIFFRSVIIMFWNCNYSWRPALKLLLYAFVHGGLRSHWLLYVHIYWHSHTDKLLISYQLFTVSLFII